MRRSFSLLLAIAVLLFGLFSFASCSENGEKAKLSELDDESLMQYLENEGVTVPNGIEVDSIRSMLVDLEADPDCRAWVVSWESVVDLFEELRVIVKSRY